MKHGFLIVCALVLTGCGDELAIHPISALVADQASTVQFTTTATKRDIYELTVTYFPKFQPLDVHDITHTIKQNPDHPELYQIDLPKLSGGEYRLVVKMLHYWRVANYKVVRSTRIDYSDFVVHDQLPNDCFHFDDAKQELMNWTVTPVYLGSRDQPFIASNCPGLFLANQSWPAAITELTNGRSLFIPVSNKCFPSASSNVSQPSYWHFTLRSPNLANRTAWQNIRAVEFRVATKSISVDIEPEMDFAGSTSSSSTNKTPARYAAYVGNWRVITHPVNIPKNSRLNHIQLHIYGIPEQTVHETVDSIVIDGICPIK
jgi:hypothetical protein